jgi:uncharacterized protein (TIGR03382 family)
MEQPPDPTNRDLTPEEQEARDVLAAEEFPMGSGDPELAPVHDVLAAEEFPLGSGDPGLHHGPFAPPADPSGIEEPHDVLAAEEFAVPAGPLEPGPGGVVTKGRVTAGTGALLAAGAAVFSVLRRRRRRSRLERLRHPRG